MEIERFAADRLGLTMKRRVTAVTPVSDGVPWLGWRVFPGLVRLDRVGRLRLCRKPRAAARRAASAGDDEAEEARAASVVGHARVGDTLALRRRVLRSES
jgi:hypothetical protein